MKQGYFITFEGTEGSGKTSIINKVKYLLEQAGFNILSTREPGGSKISEEIRETILNPENTKMDAKTEALLYAASRRQHLTEIIIPAINNKQIVLCDRYLDSSLAYQGFGRDLGFNEVLNLNQFAIDNYLPDLTIFIDVSPEVGLKRIKENARHQNRLDLEKLSFHHKVYDGYQKLLTHFPQRIKRIDGERSLDEVIKDVYQIIINFLEINNEL